MKKTPVLLDFYIKGCIIKRKNLHPRWQGCHGCAEEFDIIIFGIVQKLGGRQVWNIRYWM